MLPLIALGVIFVGATASRATPVDGSMSVGVDTSIFASGFAFNSGADSASWSGTPASLSVAATAPSALPSGSATNAFANGTAAWAADGNSGSVAFNYGWSFVDGLDYANPGMQTNGNGPNWSYTFVADATGNFVLNYNLISIGDPLGLHKGFYIGSDGGSTLNLFAAGSGTFIQAVTAGSTYNVSFMNNGNSFDRDGGLDVAIEGTFNWTLPGGASTRVPETSSTFALLGLGLGGLGCAARRWRRVQAA